MREIHGKGRGWLGVQAASFGRPLPPLASAANPQRAIPFAARPRHAMIKYFTLLWLGLAAGTAFGQAPGAKLWDFTAAGRINSSPALAPDGTIYVGAGTVLHAINPDGTAKWKVNAGGQVFSSPALGFDGTIYFGSFDKKLYAVEPNGSLKWTFATEGRIYSSPAVDLNGTIYFGSDDTMVYAVSLAGERKWAYATGGYVRSSPVLGTDGSLYVGSWDQRLYSLSADGRLNWTFESGHYVFSSPALAPDGTIYLGSVDKKLYALSPDGAKKWEFTAGSHLYASPSVGPDGTIYVGSWDNRIYALTPAGTQKWAFATGNLVQSSPAVAADGTIYCGSDENKLYAIGPDGVKKWSYATGSLVRSSPVIAPDGTIYVGSEDAKLYAFKGLSGPAPSSWPMFRADVKRRGKVLLVITNQPQSQVVVAGKNASLTLGASGAGPMGFQWRHQGTNLPGANATNLVIASVSPAHAGEYNVVVSNGVETVASAIATLAVIVPPVMAQQPETQMVAAGSNATLRVAALSLGPLTYRWMLNGSNVPAATAQSLIIPEAQLAHAGDYAVAVANAAGAITSTVAKLTIVTPPEIVEQPQPQLGAVGSKVTFAVSAKSLTPLSYRWRFNNTNLPGATSSNLTLNNLQPSNAGNYSAIVSNLAGSVASATVGLTVDLPPVITTALRNHTGVAGKNLTLSVAAQSAGPLKYQWLRAGASLPGATGGELTLTNLQPSQAGLYAVVLSNVAGAITSPPVVVTVFSPPVITHQPLSQTVSVGSSVLFKMEAEGTPPLKYFWKFNSTPLPAATNTFLEILQATAENQGDYSVVVTNSAGMVASQAARLSVPASTSLWQRFKSWF